LASEKFLTRRNCLHPSVRRT